MKLTAAARRRLNRDREEPTGDDYDAALRELAEEGPPGVREKIAEQRRPPLKPTHPRREWLESFAELRNGGDVTQARLTVKEVLKKNGHLSDETVSWVQIMLDVMHQSDFYRQNRPEPE
jgi:hypothetical protein